MRRCGSGHGRSSPASSVREGRHHIASGTVMKIGILGAGFMGTTHARAYAKIPGISVAAVSSRQLEKAQRLAAEVGARATTDDRSIIEDPSIAAISNTLPGHLHVDPTVAALRAGKHVLLEKPVVIEAADADGLFAAG